MSFVGDLKMVSRAGRSSNFSFRTSYLPFSYLSLFLLNSFLFSFLEINCNDKNVIGDGLKDYPE